MAKKSNYYINRELSWLDFNARVLEEAVKPSNPPLERIKFLSIYASNIDEFYMVRVGSLIDQSIADHDFIDPISGMTSEQQLTKVYNKTKQIDKDLIAQTPYILNKLSDHHISFKKPSEVEDPHELENMFERSLMPILTIMVLDKKHPFPYISNKSVFCGVKLLTKNEKTRYGVVLLPKNADMVYFETVQNGKIEYLLLEDIVEFFKDKLFENYTVIKSGIFKVTRNADLILDDDLIGDNDDYKQAMSDILKRRRMLTPVRLQTTLKDSGDLVTYITKKLRLDFAQVFFGYPYLYTELAWDIIRVASENGMEALLFKKFDRVSTKGLEKGVCMTDKVLEKDYLLVHPYERFETIIALLREAARDPYVLSIKQTLYRVGNDSAIIRALVEAAENGKDVTVLVELKARFDEQNNLNYASKLEDAGCRVIYGKDNLKVHAKSILITRKDKWSVNYICHLGTGNYNESTAKLYTDVGILTSDKQIALDLINFYNVLQGAQHEEYAKLLVAPKGMRKKMYALIDGEIDNVKKGLPGHIVAKFNSLADKEMIDKLVDASRHGVKIQLFIRGICCLKAGIPGVSDNIEVISVVGRFLEHARMYWFYNGGQDKMYISSADYMSRNLSRRFELSCPVEDDLIRKRLLDSMLIMAKDYGHGRVMIKNATYVPIQKQDGYISDSQMLLYGKSFRLSKESKEVEDDNSISYNFRKGFSRFLYQAADRISPKR
jgi:polyphosphate kinase